MSTSKETNKFSNKQTVVLTKAMTELNITCQKIMYTCFKFKF